MRPDGRRRPNPWAARAMRRACAADRSISSFCVDGRYGRRMGELRDAPPDLALGAFSDEPPWIVDPDDLPWRIGLDRVRERTRRDVPRLLRRRRLPPGG